MKLEHYTECSKICRLVYNDIKEMCANAPNQSTRDICQFGYTRINEECAKVFKKVAVKGVAFPTSISLNNCVGYFAGDTEMKTGDVVKVELGVFIGNSIVIYGDTFVSGQQGSKFDGLLDDLEKYIINDTKHGITNDDIKTTIESKCLENNVFPVENTISYQHSLEAIRGLESKYMILNYQKYFDDDDGLVGEPNLCFEFEENEVYTINLAIVENIENTDDFKYIEKHDPHIYRFNDYFYNLKLKSSREFFSKCKQAHGKHAFVIEPYKTNVKDRIGIKECLDSGILEPYDVLYVKPELPVYHRKFTIIVGKETSKKF
jgi:methionine aminopeptidase